MGFCSYHYPDKFLSKDTFIRNNKCSQQTKDQTTEGG